MAHTPETRTTFDDWLKYNYKDQVVETVAEQSVLMRELMRRIRTAPFGGKSVSFPVLYNSMGSVGSRAESDALPESLPGNYDLSTVSIYYHNFSICVSGDLIDTTQSNDDAFARAWAQEVMIKQKAFAQHINRQLCSDGNAILCQVDGNASGQTVTVDNMYGLSGYNASPVNGATFITPNMFVQARNSSGTAHDSGLKVTAIATRGAFPSTSAALTVSGTCSSVVDGDYLYTAHSSTQSYDNYGHEMAGIRLLIDDNTVTATVQSISATTYPEWRAQIGYGSTAGTAEALTPSRMMNLLTDIQIKGGKTDFIVTSPAVWHTYGMVADSRNQITNASTYDVMFPSLEFAGIKVYMDPYCVDELFYIDTRSLALFQAGEQGWIQAPNTGLVISQRKGASAAYHEFEAYWNWACSLGVLNRSWNGKLVDISVAVDKLL